MIETIKRVVADMLNMQARTQYGTVTAYNPNNYTVKVMLQPNGPETGFIPLTAAWAGNNLGAVFGPPIGTDCRVDFVDGVVEASIAGGRFFNSKNPPPVVQAGQGAIVDGSGSFVKLNNDGTITLGAPAGITSTTPLLKQVGNFQVTGSTELDGNVTMKSTASVAQVATVGALASNGSAGASTFTGNLTVSSGDVSADGITLKTHYHQDPQGGNTGTAL
jgi:phage baseplate assembly protein gpV